MARTKTNTQNDTKTRWTSWRNRHIEKTIIFFVFSKSNTRLTVMRWVWFRCHSQLTHVGNLSVACRIKRLVLYDPGTTGGTVVIRLRRCGYRHQQETNDIYVIESFSIFKIPVHSELFLSAYMLKLFDNVFSFSETTVF